jgi:hypothetical protein
VQEAGETTIGRNDDCAFGERSMEGGIHRPNGSRARPAAVAIYRCQVA